MSYKIQTRQAGESLRDKLEDLRALKGNDFTSFPIAAGAVLFICSAVYFQLVVVNKMSLVAASAIFIVSLVFFFLKRKQHRLVIKNYEKGLAGEKYVGAILERYRYKGAEVFHDLEFENFNIDHLLISTKGVFIIETKNYTQVSSHKLQIENETLIINGFRNNEILKKVTYYSEVLSNTFKLLEIEKLPIKKVVLFPGWFIEGKNAFKDFWVLNEKSLHTYFQNAPDKLNETEVKELTRVFRAWLLTRDSSKL
ncbi:NERD domain-containing protein [Fibrobacterales bacterium]|nr:NERD domain-containing protein [Fibrobacterales bacterium]